jgi:hypothetical protein
MSIVCCLKQASDEQLDRLIATPPLIEPFLRGPGRGRRPAPGQKSAAEKVFGCILWPVVGLLSLLFIRRLPPLVEDGPGRRKTVELPDDWPEPHGTPEIDVDKAWEGIHFLLTGSDQTGGEEPLCYLASGGTEIGSVDVGSGPARRLTSDQTRQFAEALSGLPDEELHARWDPAEVLRRGLYPPFLGERPDDDLEYLLGHFATLKQFVQGAADGGMGLVVWLC